MTFAWIEPVARAAQPWADLYNASSFLQTGVTFAHFAGLLVAGGFAVATDRMALRLSRRHDGDRRMLLSELAGVHRLVLAGLVVVTLTGLAMALADAEWVLAAPLFWLKMGAFALLLVNGLVLMRTERRLHALVEGPRAGADEEMEAWHAAEERSWGSLRWTAVRSMALWGVTLLLGTLLTGV